MNGQPWFATWIARHGRRTPLAGWVCDPPGAPGRPASPGEGYCTPGALTELGISAQGAEISSPDLDEVFSAQIPVPAPSDDLTPEAIEEFQAALAGREDAGEAVEREFC